MHCKQSIRVHNFLRGDICNIQMSPSTSSVATLQTYKSAVPGSIPGEVCFGAHVQKSQRCIQQLDNCATLGLCMGTSGKDCEIFFQANYLILYLMEKQAKPVKFKNLQVLTTLDLPVIIWKYDLSEAPSQGRPGRPRSPFDFGI